MEPDLNEVDIHCIKHYGYNTVGDVNNLKAKQDKDHLIIEEFEYRNKMLEEQVEKLNYIKRNFDYCVAQEKKKLEDKIEAKIEELYYEQNNPYVMGIKESYTIKDLTNIIINEIQSLLEERSK